MGALINLVYVQQFRRPKCVFWVRKRAGSDRKTYCVPRIEKSCYCYTHSLVAPLPTALL